MGAVDGAPLTTWRDISGNDNHAVLAVGTAPTWRSNPIEELVFIDRQGERSATAITSASWTDDLNGAEATFDIRITGSADWCDLGFLDGAVAPTANNLGLSVSGVLGVRLDLYNSRALLLNGGSISGAVSLNPRTTGVKETWGLKWVRSGSNVTLTLRRSTGVVGSWTVPSPSWSSWRLAMGARTGGQTGTFVLVDTPEVVLSNSTVVKTVSTPSGDDWTRNACLLAASPRGPVVSSAGVGTYRLPSGVMSGAVAGGEAFAVIKRDGTPSSSLWNFGSFADTGWYPFNGAELWEQFGRSNGRVTKGVSGSSLVVRHTYSVASSASSIVLRRNGSVIHTGGAGTVGWANPPFIGGGYRAADYSERRFAGDMWLFLIYNRVLTSEERLALDAWVADNQDGGSV